MRKFEYIKLDSLNFDLSSNTTSKGRTYTTPEGNVYPSITTVLSGMNKEHIQKWIDSIGEKEANRIKNKAADRGTKLHEVCEKYLLNEMTEFKLTAIMPDIGSLFIKLYPELDKNIGKVYVVEQALYSDEMKVAGRVDCIAEWNGKLSVIDFKTSTKIKKEENIQNYFMQCSAYSQMFLERTGILIDQIVVAIAVEESNVSQIFVRETNDYLQKTKDYIQNYHNNLNK